MSVNLSFIDKTSIYYTKKRDKTSYSPCIEDKCNALPCNHVDKYGTRPHALKKVKFSTRAYNHVDKYVGVYNRR